MFSLKLATHKGAFLFALPLKICLNFEVSLLGPVTTPEHQLLKTPSSSSLSQRVRSTLTKNTPRYVGLAGLGTEKGLFPETSLPAFRSLLKGKLDEALS